MYTFVFSIILAVQPVPIFAFVSDHDSMEECQEAIAKFDGDEELKNSSGCMILVKPENFREGKGV